MEADKIIKGMEMCISPDECSPDDCPYYDRPRNESGLCWDRLMTDAIALLKELQSQIEILEYKLAVAESNLNYYINGND